MYLPSQVILFSNRLYKIHHYHTKTKNDLDPAGHSPQELRDNPHYYSQTGINI